MQTIQNVCLKFRPIDYDKKKAIHKQAISKANKIENINTSSRNTTHSSSGNNNNNNNSIERQHR